MAFDLEKFNSQVYTTATELVDQQVNLFNEASDGALVLAPSSANMGDFSIRAGFKLISGLVRRRDANNGTDPIATARLLQLKEASVKVAAGTPPIAFEPAQYRWIQQNPELAALTIGSQLSQAMLQDELNVAISGLVAAISNNTEVVNDISAATVKTPTLSSLVSTAMKFGDRSNAIRVWIMHSKSMGDIYQEGIKNGEQLFQYGDVAVTRDPFGRLYIMTDSPALYVPGTTGKPAEGDTPEAPATPAKYHILGLASQAALVQPNNDFEAVLVDKTGTENIQRTYQAEWSYNVGLLGYSWKAETGGSSPSSVALGTAANWQQIATSKKDTAGVLMITG